MQDNYLFLAKQKGINLSKTQVDAIVSYLAKEKLLYQAWSFKGLDKVKESLLWQTREIKTADALRRDNRFIELIKAVHKGANELGADIEGLGLVTAFLVAIWEQGKLGIPGTQQDPELKAKPKAKPKAKQDTSLTPGRKSLSSGPNKPMDPGRSDVREELERWKKLAGILRD